MEQENIRQQDLAQQRETDLYSHLLNSDNRTFQDYALSGLLEGTSPKGRKGGLAGFVGEREASPVYQALQKYRQTALPEGQTSLGGVQPTVTDRGPAGSAAMPTTSSVSPTTPPPPAPASYQAKPDIGTARLPEDTIQGTGSPIPPVGMGAPKPVSDNLMVPVTGGTPGQQPQPTSGIAQTAAPSGGPPAPAAVTGAAPASGGTQFPRAFMTPQERQMSQLTAPGEAAYQFGKAHGLSEEEAVRMAMMHMGGLRPTAAMIAHPGGNATQEQILAQNPAAVDESGKRIDSYPPGTIFQRQLNLLGGTEHYFPTAGGEMLQARLATVRQQLVNEVARLPEIQADAALKQRTLNGQLTVSEASRIAGQLLANRPGATTDQYNEWVQALTGGTGAQGGAPPAPGTPPTAPSGAPPVPLAVAGGAPSAAGGTTPPPPRAGLPSGQSLYKPNQQEQGSLDTMEAAKPMMQRVRGLLAGHETENSWSNTFQGVKAEAQSMVGHNPSNPMYAELDPLIQHLKVFALGPYLHGIRNGAFVKSVSDNTPSLTDTPARIIQKLDNLEKNFKDIEGAIGSAAPGKPGAATAPAPGTPGQPYKDAQGVWHIP